MSRLSSNDEIDWLKEADEFLTEQSFGPVDRQDRELYETRYFRRLEIADRMRFGFEKSRREPRQQVLLKWGTKLFGEPTPQILLRFNAIKELDQLDEMIDRILDCNSWESLLRGGAQKLRSFLQREIFEKLAKICELSPDVRIGQMLAHLGFLSEDFGGQSLGVVEDEALLAVAERHLANLTARGSTTQPAMPPETDKAVAARPTMPMLNS